MTTAHCPNCNSTLYTPDPSNGGAGRNKCLECGQASTVARWYDKPKHGDIRSAIVASDDQSFTIRTTAFIDPRTLHPPTPAGISSTPRATREPAPIRQYKDDDE